MKLTRLKVTIEPLPLRNGAHELRAKAVVDGVRQYTLSTLHEDDMESMFDRLMDQARREIVRMAKAHSQKTP